MQSVANPTTSVNWHVAPATAKPTPRQRYDAGFNAYCNGVMLDDVEHDNIMRRGFMAALAAEAACVSGYDVKAAW